MVGRRSGCTVWVGTYTDPTYRTPVDFTQSTNSPISAKFHSDDPRRRVAGGLGVGLVGMLANHKHDSSKKYRVGSAGMHESQGSAFLKRGGLVARWTFKGLLGYFFGGLAELSD